MPRVVLKESTELDPPRCEFTLHEEIAFHIASIPAHHLHTAAVSKEHEF